MGTEAISRGSLEEVNDVTAQIKEFKKGHAIFLMSSGIQYSMITSGKVSDDADPENFIIMDIQQIWLFNKCKDCRIWRNHKGLSYRIRNENNSKDFQESKMMLRPELAKKIKTKNVDFASVARIGITQHQIIGYDQITGQAGYVDYRLIEFTDMTNKN